MQAIDVYRQLCIQLYMYAYARVMCIQNKTEHTKCICIYLTKNTTWNTDATLRHMLNNKSYFWLLSYLQEFDLADFFIQWIHGWIPDATTDAFVCLHLLFSF